jgi:hypothetical protein
MQLPRFANPKILKVDPILFKFLIDKEDPICRQSKAEKSLPTCIIPYVDMELPNLANVLIERPEDI